MVNQFARRLRTRVLPNLRYLPGSRLRVCHCCLRPTVYVSFSEGEEFKVCLRCRANHRYEMLSEHLRAACPDLERLVVVELDPRSPLRPVLRRAGTYVRTYYSATDPPGTLRPDGARCEDVTRMTFGDASVDVLISSDVLEHVPDVRAAFSETARVLRPGGFHLFTVPPRAATRRRAEVRDGHVVHLLEPEYHSDPLDPPGILAYWDFGLDAVDLFQVPGLQVGVVAGPEGRDGRLVWKATRLAE